MASGFTNPELPLAPPPVRREPLPVHRALLWVITPQLDGFGRAPNLRTIAQAMRWRRKADAVAALEEMRRRALIDWDGRDAASIRLTDHGRRWL